MLQWDAKDVPRGQSGRIVLEIDPDIKHELYIALAREDLTLKAWFLEQAREYVSAHAQPRLSFGAPQRPGLEE
jgi:hypothetical protein